MYEPSGSVPASSSRRARSSNVNRSENGGSFLLRCETLKPLFFLSEVLIIAPQIGQIMLCEMGFPFLKDLKEKVQLFSGQVHQNFQNNATLF